MALVLTACGDRPRDSVSDPFAEVLNPAADAAPLPDATETGTQAPRRAVARPSERAIRGFVRHGVQTPVPLGSGAGGQAAAGGAGEITLDFRDADLASVVQVMLEDGLGANYVIDPSIDGSVTLRSNRPLRREEILPTLEEILRLNDAAIVERAGTFRVVPRAEAGLSAPVVGARDVVARGLTVRVSPLRFVQVEDVSRVLDEFAPVAGQITYDPVRNLVFTIGTEAEQRTINDLIATLDVDYLAGRSFALLPLREGNPVAVSDEMQLMFAQPSGAPDPRVRFLPITRMNAVLVMADRPGLVDQAVDIVRFLDQGAGETPRLHVFSVQNRRASEVAAILGDIFDAEVRGSGAGRREDVLASGLSPRRDRTGGVERGLGVTGGADLAEADQDAPEVRASAFPDGDAQFPRSARSGRGTAGGELGGRAGVFSITADESANAIVALATSTGANALADALARLDTQPLQVLIEATLVEVALNDSLEFGVRWFLQSGNFNFSFGDALGAGAANVFPGFNAAFRTTDVNVTLSALDEVTDVRILSSPTLMVLDNRVARLQVGDQVPVTVRSTQPVDSGDAPIVQETEFRDTGVILEIRPTVNAGGLVVLEIRQEVSAVAETDADGGNPTFSQRVVESTIAVQSGETIALAGLIEEGQTIGRDGIPGLSRIPVVGNLFGTTVDSVSRSELMVLIRPLVVRDQTEAREATAELRRKIVNLLPAGERQGLRPF